MSQAHESTPVRPQPAQGLALVLGAGGAAGQAWQIGVIAGLAEAGLDLTRAADLVIGTSSGSTTAAWVRSGTSPADLLNSVLSQPVRPAGQQRERPPSSLSQPVRPAGQQGERPSSMAALFDRMRAISAAAASAADLQRAMGAFGLESDAAFGPDVVEQRRAMIAARMPRPEWPDRPMIVVALNAHTGELAPFDKESGVELVDALTAAVALPGGAPTHEVNGIRYINGGVRSPDNADLAAGYAKVLVLSPFSERSGPLPEGQFEGLRRFPGADLPSQIEVLREQGSQVQVITPDADSRAAMGVNQMDPATRAPSARAGYAQGHREAARVTFR